MEDYANVYYSNILYEGDMIEIDENTFLIGTKKDKEKEKEPE